MSTAITDSARVQIQGNIHNPLGPLLIPHYRSSRVTAYGNLTVIKTFTLRETLVLGKAILWISAFIFIGYGLVCLVSPELPAAYAGLAMTTGDAYAEIGAMYGGLQTGFGVFCLLGALRTDFYRPALASLVFLVGGLALARLYSTAMSNEPVAFYTYGAIVFESVTAVLAGVALRKP
jgi:hypothetical protein